MAAIGCAIAGYTGGKFLNKMNKKESTQDEVDSIKTDIDAPGSSQKKDM